MPVQNDGAAWVIAPTEMERQALVEAIKDRMPSLRMKEGEYRLLIFSTRTVEERARLAETVRGLLGLELRP